MARDLSKIKIKFKNALRTIYSAANYGSEASSMTIEQLQRLVEMLYTGHNNLRESWDDLVGLVGAEVARELIALEVSSVPETISSDLIQIRSDIIAILTAYQNNYGEGVSNKTFASTLSDGLFTGGFTDVTVSSNTLSALNGLCATLVASVTPLTPVN